MAILLSIIISVTTKNNRSNSWIEGFAIFFTMVISVFIATITNYELNKEFIKLNQVFEQTKEVIKLSLLLFLIFLEGFSD